MTDLELGRIAFGASSDLWAQRLRNKDSGDNDNWPSSEEILVAVGKAVRESASMADFNAEIVAAVKAERERCAGIAESISGYYKQSATTVARPLCFEIAATIRRGE